MAAIEGAFPETRWMFDVMKMGVDEIYRAKCVLIAWKCIMLLGFSCRLIVSILPLASAFRIPNFGHITS